MDIKIELILYYYYIVGIFIPNYFMFMANPKRSSDGYIQLNKKITNKEIRNIICIIARDWKMTEQEVCYEFIRDRSVKEIEKRKNQKPNA